MKGKGFLMFIGIILILVGLFFMFSTGEFGEKGEHYEYQYIFDGEDPADESKADCYYSLAEFGEKGSWPCVFIGGLLLVVSFIGKEEKNS